MWIELYLRDPLKSKCADKYGVREYIENLGEDKRLNDLYNVYVKVEDMVWNYLPESFVLKVNNKCGANIICSDKKNLNEKQFINNLSKSIKEKYYLINTL